MVKERWVRVEGSNPVNYVKASVNGVLTEAHIKGIRYDEGKERYDLIAPHALHELAKVYSMGSIKYSPNNWLRGLSWGKTFAAAMRHAWAWMRGEKIDKESSCHHLAHCAWGMFALIEFETLGLGEDDRFKKPPSA